MGRDPDQFRRGEAGHRLVARHRPQRRPARLQHPAFGRRTSVIPKDGGSQRLVIGAQQHRAVHMARQPDAFHGGNFEGVARLQRIDGAERRVHPVVRALLGKTRLRPLHLERQVALARTRCAAVDEDRLDGRRPDINAKKHLSVPCPLVPAKSGFRQV